MRAHTHTFRNCTPLSGSANPRATPLPNTIINGGRAFAKAQHKSNLPHPGPDDVGKAALKQSLLDGEGMAVDDVDGAVEVFMQAGDALLFSDAIAHGSARRVNEGYR